MAGSVVHVELPSSEAMEGFEYRTAQVGPEHCRGTEDNTISLWQNDPDAA